MKEEKPISLNWNTQLLLNSQTTSNPLLYLREEGYYCTNNKQDYNLKLRVMLGIKLVVIVKAKRKNIHWRKRDEGQPFSIFNFKLHMNHSLKQQQQEVFLDPNDIEFIPPYFPDDPVIKRDMAINYSNLVRMDNEVGEIILELKKQGYTMTPIFLL